MRARTGAERYFLDRLEDPEYKDAYRRARDRIERVDAVIRAIEERRQELGLTKADLGRRAGLRPAAIRRLLSAREPNPTLSTLVAIADALELSLAMTPASTERVASA